MAGKRQSINIPEGKKVFFASDQHLGAPSHADSLRREKIFVQWLDEIKPTCEALFLLGDLFDFWFEYQQVVPKGFVRVLGKLAEFSDAGIPIHFFTGNHDLWMNDYLQKEIGVKLYRKKQYFEINDKLFLMAHGDGLGPGDKGYKRMKKLFTNRIAQWFFRWLHPDIGVWLGNYFSQKNKLISGEEDITYLGEANEWLVQYAKKKVEELPIDYFIFGHRHLPLDISLENARYINLGDWIKYYTFAHFNGETLKIESYNWDN